MKAAITRLLHRFDREVIERQIEEELRFHLELLTQAASPARHVFGRSKGCRIKTLW